ncbi:MAG TPA: hypothetical protein VK850_10940, partial [Candidatus Binatia bacterium]|nr:hypothetical protein [Candidatus Binatia bacterium]
MKLGLGWGIGFVHKRGGTNDGTIYSMNMASIPFPVFTGKDVTFMLICYLLGSFTSGYYWVR